MHEPSYPELHEAGLILRYKPPYATAPPDCSEILISHGTLLLGESAASEFTCHYEGVSHAQWPKYKHQYAPP
jgi:hypothetical protein